MSPSFNCRMSFYSEIVSLRMDCDRISSNWPSIKIDLDFCRLSSLRSEGSAAVAANVISKRP